MAKGQASFHTLWNILSGKGGVPLKWDRTSVRYGTLLLTATGLVNQLLGFVYRILLSRLVGAEVMGLYQLVMPVFSVLLSVTAIGLTAAVANLTAQYRALGRETAAEQVLRRCLVLLVCLLALPTLALLLLSDPISVHILGDARTRLGLLLLPPCVLLTGVENLHKHAFYGAGLVRPPAFSELLEQVVRTGAVLGLLLLFLPQNPERTVGLIVTGMVVCEVCSACTLTALWHRQRRSGGAPETRRTLDRRIAKVALPVACTALLGNLMGSACAVLIPQKLVEGGMEVSRAVSAFGVMFGMSLPMLGLPTAFISALGLVLMPRLSQAAALGRWEEVRRRVDGAMLATSVLILPAMALLSVLGPDLAVRLFREPAAGAYLTPLAVSVALSCWRSVLACSLNGVGRQAAAARNALLAGAAELALTALTVGLPGVGLKGYVLAALVSEGLGLALNLFSLCRAAGLRPQLFRWLAAPGLAALLMGLDVNLLYCVLRDRDFSGALSGGVCLLFGAVVYLAALSAQGVSLQALLGLEKKGVCRRGKTW